MVWLVIERGQQCDEITYLDLKSSSISDVQNDRWGVSKSLDEIHQDVRVQVLAMKLTNLEPRKWNLLVKRLR